MTSKWDLFWDLLHGLWIIALYIFILLAILRKDWAEATMWLVWLIFDHIKTREAA